MSRWPTDLLRLVGDVRRLSFSRSLAELVQVDARLKTLKAVLIQAVLARGTWLMTITVSARPGAGSSPMWRTSPFPP